MTRELHRRLAIGWSAAEGLVTLLSSLAIALVAARLIGPHAFGVASMALFMVAIAETVVLVPFAEPLVQRRRIDPSYNDAAFTSMLVLAVVCYAALVTLSFPISVVYQLPQLPALVAASAVSCVLVACKGSTEAILAKKLRFRQLAIRGIFSKASSAVVAVALGYLHFGEWSLVLSALTFSVISTVATLTAVRRWPRFRFDLPKTLELLRFGSYSLVDAFMTVLVPRLFAFFLGYVSGEDALGRFAMALRLADSVASLLSAVVVRTALPVFAHLRYMSDALSAAWLTGTRYVALIALPTFGGLALVADDLANVALGPSWQGVPDQIRYVSLYYIFNFSFVLTQPALKAAGHPATLISLQIGSIAFLFVFAMFFYSVEVDVSLAYALLGPAYAIICSILLRIYVQVPVSNYAKIFLTPIAATIVMSITVTIVQMTAVGMSEIRLPLSVIVGSSMYFVSIAAIDIKLVTAAFSSLRGGQL